ncbi:unnamed protein product [Arabidopsis arenosa]|uniref:F-box domain-containing protein n=1 Tax=Arabidopsis arenosa TaxID=38785 RepID=A0A8S2ACX3_ARAAE|nr:unnamed protein product [Arabidopsis arenosa]
MCYKKKIAIQKSGEVLIILSLFQEREERYSFYIFKMNLESGKWERVDSIGDDEMLIFGHGVTIRAPVQDVGDGVKSGSICFVKDDVMPGYYCPSNCGVFDLATILSMISNPSNKMDSEIAFDRSPAFRVYKSGRIERLLGETTVPPSLTPQNGVVSKDVIYSPEKNLSLRIYLPEKVSDVTVKKLPILIYFHGGGFIIETAFSPTYHTFLTSAVAAANCLAISVNYRRAPEFPIQIPYEDSWDSLKWVLTHITETGPETWINKHCDFGKVFLAGDSAGGNIAHHLTIRAEREKLETVTSGIILIHPYFWGKTPIDEFEVRDVGKTKGVEGSWRVASPNSKEGVDDPWLNVVGSESSDLSGLGCGRVLVMVAGDDVFVRQGWCYAGKLKKSGWEGEVEVMETKNEGHVFHLKNPNSDNARQVVKKLAEFINNRQENRKRIRMDMPTDLMKKEETQKVSDSHDWSKLCPDLLRKIIDSLSSLDFYRAKIVCSDWYSVWKTCVKRPLRPWRIIYEEKYTYCPSMMLFDPDEEKIYRELAGVSDKSYCLASSGNWLLMADSRLDFYIVNLLTGKRINLPPMESKIRGAEVRFKQSRHCSHWGYLLIDQRWEIIWERRIAIQKSGEVLIILRVKAGDHSCSFWIFKMNLESRKWERVDSIGDDEMIIFGHGATIRAHVQDVGDGVKSGSIWFVKFDHRPFRGVFDLATEQKLFAQIGMAFGKHVQSDVYVHGGSYANMILMNLESGKWERVHSIGDDEMLIFGHGVTIRAPVQDAGDGIKSGSIFFAFDGGLRSDYRCYSDCGIFDIATMRFKRSNKPEYGEWGHFVEYGKCGQSAKPFRKDHVSKLIYGSQRSAVLWINEKTSDYVVAWIFKQYYLFTYKKGDESWWNWNNNWKPGQGRLNLGYLDLAYENSNLYLYTTDDHIKIIDFSRDFPKEEIENNPYLDHPFNYAPQGLELISKRRIAIQKSGEVLIIVSLLEVLLDEWTPLFYIFKMNLESGKWERVHSIGDDEMLIFGHGVTIRAPVQDVGDGIKNGSICFVKDDVCPGPPGFDCPSNCGVFDLATSEITWPNRVGVKTQWFVPGFV